MSIYYSAYLLYGYKVDIKEHYENITKYNEDTGKPYSKRVYVYDDMLIDNIFICNNKHNEDMFCCGETIEGLEIIYSGYGGNDNNDYYLGSIIEKVDDDCVAKTIDKSNKMNNTLELFSIKYNICPDYYLIIRCG